MQAASSRKTGFERPPRRPAIRHVTQGQCAVDCASLPLVLEKRRSFRQWPVFVGRRRSRPGHQTRQGRFPPGRLLWLPTSIVSVQHGPPLASSCVQQASRRKRASERPLSRGEGKTENVPDGTPIAICNPLRIGPGAGMQGLLLRAPMSSREDGGADRCAEDCLSLLAGRPAPPSCPRPPRAKDWRMSSCCLLHPGGRCKFAPRKPSGGSSGPP